MYLDYFSLKRHPFRITPDPSLFFAGGKDGRGVVLNALIYGINSGEGILKVVGEVGSGKTMLCRMLEGKLPESVEIVYLANPNLSAREILYAIAIELKLDVTASTERLKVLHQIQDYLLRRHGEGGTVVVFIEEAQSMPLETLEEIRLLSNLETHQHKLMQIILFGQPELDKILQQKNIRQLRERITHSFTLEPLDAASTSDYIRFRLNAAGCPWPGLFSPKAVKMLASASQGLTRRINILADKALLAAYADSPGRLPPAGAGQDLKPLVLPRHVRAAIKDSGYKNQYSGALAWGLGGLAAAAILGAAIVLGMRYLDGSPGFGNASVATTESASTGPVTRSEGATDTAMASEAGRAAARTPVADTVVPPETALASAVPGAQLTMEPEVVPDPEDNEGAGAAGLPATNLAAQGEVMVMPDTVPATASTDFEEPVSDAIETPVDSSGSKPDPAASRVADNTPAASPVESVEAEPDTPSPVAGPGSASQRGLSPAPVTPTGIAALRMASTTRWLESLPGKSGYTIQLFSVPSTNANGLEEFLQFLQLASLLDETYICFMPVSSSTSGRWQVMHREFPGVTPARNYIQSLPPYAQQYGPYVRNLNSIECSYPVPTGD